MKRAYVSGHVIHTEFVNPPIPLRSFDWQATIGPYDEGNLVGNGPTEITAIADLLDQVAERDAENDLTDA